MEKLGNIETSRKTGLMGKTLTFALAVALSVGNVSCGKTTQKDIVKQQKKIESVSFQISHYIQARKELVMDYNKLLAYPKTDSNKADINKSLAQIYEKITEYDEKLEDLAEDRIEAINDLNEYISDIEVDFSPNEPIDPNRWDFLLAMK